jgi:hypothetical protein
MLVALKSSGLPVHQLSDYDDPRPDIETDQFSTEIVAYEGVTRLTGGHTDPFCQCRARRRANLDPHQRMPIAWFAGWRSVPPPVSRQYFHHCTDKQSCRSPAKSGYGRSANADKISGHFDRLTGQGGAEDGDPNTVEPCCS